MSQCVEVVECCKGQRYQTFTTYQLQHVEQLYNNSQRSFHLSPRCLSTDGSPIEFKGVICCHGTVRPAWVQQKGVLQDILKGLTTDKFWAQGRRSLFTKLLHKRLSSLHFKWDWVECAQHNNTIICPIQSSNTVTPHVFFSEFTRVLFCHQKNTLVTQ